MKKIVNLMVLAKGTSGQKGCGYMHGMPCISMMDPLVEKKEEAFKNTCSSSSTSSIGQNSDISGRVKENCGDIDEVQSSYKGPLDAMEALEEVLPVRRGISNFYNGKSKSFACLSDASKTCSTKALAKPENAYIRRRRNLLSTSLVLDSKNKYSPLKNNGGGVSKRVVGSPSRATLALAIAASSANRNSNGSWRSLSYADFRHCISCPAECTHTSAIQPDAYASHT